MSVREGVNLEHLDLVDNGEGITVRHVDGDVLGICGVGRRVSRA